MIVTTTNDELAAVAQAELERHKARTPGRHAATMLWVALITTETAGSARRALDTFGTDQGRSGALELLARLLQRIGQSADNPSGCPRHGTESTPAGATP
jgi:hypothetical protein